MPGLWCWERRPRGLRPGEFGGRTSYAVIVANDVLLLDPLVHGDDDPALDALDDLVCDRVVRVLVTMPYHARSSESLSRRYRARIYGHPRVATRLGDVSRFEAVSGGDEVDGIARFHALGSPRRSQQLIEIPLIRALVFGDAVVDTGGGELRVWAASADSLRALADLDVDHVLVTHGRPAIADGKAALQQALSRPPWRRPKR